jgi:hypothetical protein
MGQPLPVPPQRRDGVRGQLPAISTMTSGFLERVDQVAFAMLGLSPDARQRCFCEAFDHALAKNPHLTEVPPEIVAFVADVFKRIAQLEQMPGGTA